MLADKLKGYRIILASQSPRRQVLLKELGLDFEVITNNEIDESWPQELTREQIPVYLAELKADHIMPEVPGDTLLITADTIVWLNGHVIGKPVDKADAVRILKELSGAVHEVITGVCLRSGDKKRTFIDSSLVYFTRLTEDEISYYVENYRPFDKAGAYGIQEWIGYIGLEKIEGSYYNVMGLPVQRLYTELKSFLL
jgi:septum formation protein